MQHYKHKNLFSHFQALSGEVKEPTGYCVCCRKSFNNQRAYDNHLNSKKHKQIAAKFDKRDNKAEIANNRLNRKPSESSDVMEDADVEDDVEIEEVDSDEWDEEEEGTVGGEAIPATDCVFCSHHSRDAERNAAHLSERHSFFIPDAEYLVDLEGLLGYLGEKVGLGLMCLWCNTRSRSFQSLSAVQRHMADKGHCKVLQEGDAFLEYSRFFDYTSSYPEEEQKGGEDKMEEGDENDDEEEVDLDRLDDTGYELVLPSGSRIGHRSLMRYYKQSLNPDRQIQVRKTNKLLSHYKALGWTGLSAAEAKT